MQPHSNNWITSVEIVTDAAPPPSVTPDIDQNAANTIDRPAKSPRRSPSMATVLPINRESADQPMRFYRNGEVDRPAFPDSDWNLDTALLDFEGLDRIAFEVYINDRGDVVRCTILEPRDLPAATRSALVDRLRQTRLIPAERSGVPVPSIRQIELSVLPAVE
jgi:hypothetical protein